jgi:hypothetical protein
MMLPLESIRIGELKPNCAMLPAIWAICASEWRLGFLGYGVSSARFQCSIRCAIACESMPHLPIHPKWRCLSGGALCAGLSNRASNPNILPEQFVVQMFWTPWLWCSRAAAGLPPGLQLRDSCRQRRRSWSSSWLSICEALGDSGIPGREDDVQDQGTKHLNSTKPNTIL